MLYTLTEEEYKDLVPKETLSLAREETIREREKLTHALNHIKSGIGCNFGGYHGSIKIGGTCDECPLSSLNMKKGFKVCQSERYGK